MTLSDLLRVKPGPVDLSASTPRGHPVSTATRRPASRRSRSSRRRLAELQEKLFADGYTDGRRALLLVIQGMDTCGKGGVLKDCVGIFDPGGYAQVVQEADQGGARARLPVAGREGGSRARVRRHLRPVPLRGRAGRAGARAGAAGRDRASLRRDQRLRAAAGRRGHHDREVHAAHLPGRADASGCWRGSTTPPSSGSTSRATSTSASSGTTTSRPTQIALERCSTDAAPWHVVPSNKKWYRSWAIATLLTEVARGHGARLARPVVRRRGGEEARGRTREARSTRPATSRRCARAARSRASSRPTTSAPTSASSSAPARGRACSSPRSSWASWPGGSASGRPSWSPCQLDAAIGRYEADEEVQDLLNASIGLNLGVDFLPGSFGYDASCSPRAGGRGPDPLARRVHRERRPLLAQPEPAGLGRRPLGDRPRRLALLPPRLARPARPSGSRRSRSTRPTTCCSATATGSPDADAELAPQVTADLLDEVLAWCRTSGWPARTTARRTRTSCSPGVSGDRALAAPGARGVNAYQYVVLRCVPRVDREEFVNVGVVLYCQAGGLPRGAHPRHPRAAAGARAHDRHRHRLRAPRRRSRRSAAATQSAGAAGRSRSARASAS